MAKCFCVLWLVFCVGLAGQTPTLREAAAQRTLLIGAAANADEFGIPNRLLEPEYAATLSSQFNLIQQENATKWAVLHNSQGTYNFSPADKLAAFAQANKMKFRGHTLLWHASNPDWLTTAAKTASPSNMAQLMREHIETVMSHYRGKAYAWDVVNEAFLDSGALRDSVWYNQPGIGVAGTAYIEQAFRWANAADPSAVLFYNDYSIEGPGTKFNAVLAMCKDFVARGVPIHGVGFQAHLTTSGFPANGQLQSNFAQMAALGLQVQITEFDVRLPIDSSGNASAQNAKAQSDIYGRILSVCLAAPNCTAFQTWGFTDKYSWIPQFFVGLGSALEFDKSYQPKAAAIAMLNALATVPPTLSAANITNAASFKGGPVSPGELITIFGANFGPAEPVGAQLDSMGKVSSNLSGTQLLFDGVAAPLVYSVAGQVSAVVPFEVSGRAQTMVQYAFNDVRSSAIAVNVVAATPAIFAANATGSGPGLILAPDYLVINESNPAAAGSTVLILATGAGIVEGGAVTGTIAAPGKQVLPVSATVGGRPATLTYAGPAPNLVNGVLQVNLLIPGGLDPGPQPIVLTVGDAASQRGITIYVK